MENKFIRKSLMAFTIINLLYKLLFSYQNIEHWSISAVIMELINVIILLAVFGITRIREKKQSEIDSLQVGNSIVSDKEITTSQWILNYLILIIPIVGIVYLVLWSNDKTNLTKSNWARATLIWIGFSVILSLILSFVIWKIFFDKYRNDYDYYRY